MYHSVSGGQVIKVIDPQSFLVDGKPSHVKDLHPYHSLTTSEEDSNGTSESEAESLLHNDKDAV